MRLVVVDVGNTSTAVGLWSGGRVTNVVHVDGDAQRARAEAEKRIVRRSGGRLVDALAFLSVVPCETAAWKAFARRFGLRFVRISHETIVPAVSLSLDYPKPETIGADRLADAAAAVDRYGAPVLVCDFGTAFTAAVITADRVWRGGVIAPGFPLMRDYMYERTAKLPRMRLGGACPKIGRSTEEAMRFGAMVGFRGMVREIVSELSGNFGAEFRLVATGGFAKWALKDIGLPFTVDPTLTLHGAGLLASAWLGAGRA